MRQAIETRYLPPTNCRGARVVAQCDAGRLVLPWRDNLDPVENHHAAAEALRERLGWYVKLIGGSTQQGYAWVCIWRFPGKEG